MGVTEPLDLQSVTANPEEITLKPGEKKEIIVKIEQNPEYKDPVTIVFDFKYFRNVLGAQLPPGVTVAKESTSNPEWEKDRGKSHSGSHQGRQETFVRVNRLPIAVLARVSITFSITTNYTSNPIYLTTLPDAKE